MLNLRNLSERKEDILDMLIMTDNIFGTPLASMQQKCEVRKRDDEAIPGKLSQQHLWPCDECSRDESGNPASHSVQDPKTNEAPASPCISTQATDECGLSACQSPGQKKEVGGLTALPFPQVQKLNVPHSLAVFWSVLQGRSSTTCTHMVCLRGLSGSAIWTILLYHPPISPTFSRVRENHHILSLIARLWPTVHWLTELLCRQPWKLPQSRDMLMQAEGKIFHPHPDTLGF